MAIAGTKLSPVPTKLNDFRSEMLLGCPTLADGHGHWNHQASEVKPTVVHNHLYLAVSRPAGRGLMVQGRVLQNMAVLTSFIGSRAEPHPEPHSIVWAKWDPESHLGLPFLMKLFNYLIILPK